MKLNKMFIRSAVVAALLFAGAANAAQYQFDISGAYTAHWELNSSAVPNDATLTAAFTFWDVEGAFANASTNKVDLTFFNISQGGGMGIDDLHAGVNLLFVDGPQLYSGSETAPVFTPGTFALTDFQGTDKSTLKITELSAVPEPATGAMLLGGLALVFASIKRRRKSVSSSTH
jgi:hypothetical protein